MQINEEIPHYTKTLYLTKEFDNVLFYISSHTNKVELQDCLKKISARNIQADIVLILSDYHDELPTDDFLAGYGISGFFISKEDQQWSTLIRIAANWTISKDYQAMLIVDDNNISAFDAIDKCLLKLSEGYDQVKTSRYLNSSAPFKGRIVERLFTGLFKCATTYNDTDCSNLLRGFSSKLLQDSRLDIFRSKFRSIELFYYIDLRSNELKYKNCEIGIDSNVHFKDSFGFWSRIHSILMALTGRFHHNAHLCQKVARNIYSQNFFISFLGFLLSFILFEPGLYSIESFNQMNEAHSGQITDDHSVFFALSWRLFILLTGVTQSMLLFQLVMFWASLYLLSRYFKSFLPYFLVFLPSVVNFLGVVWKDVSLAYSFLLGVSIYINFRYSTKARFLSLFFFLYGFLIRPNAFFAVMPLIYLLFESQASRVKRIGYTVVTSLGFLFIFLVTSKSSSIDIKNNALKKLFVFDIAAVSSLKNKNFFKPEIQKAYKIEQIIARYDADSVIALFDSYYEDHFIADELSTNTLYHNWIEVIRFYPYQYFKHRLNYFLSLLRLTSFKGFYINHRPQTKLYLENGLRPNKTVIRIFNSFVDLFSMTPLMWGWPWLFLSFVMCFNHRKIVKSVSLASMAYTVPFFFIGLASDFRYFYTSSLLILFNLMFFVIKKTHD